jgi:hypothetical protein
VAKNDRRLPGHEFWWTRGRDHFAATSLNEHRGKYSPAPMAKICRPGGGGDKSPALI